jgi:hypothetical protein
VDSNLHDTMTIIVINKWTKRCIIFLTYVNNKMDVRVLSIISPSCIYYIAMKMSSWKIAYSTSLDLFFLLVNLIKYVETIKLETYPMDAIKTWLIKIEVIPRLFVTTVLHISTQSLLFIIIFFFRKYLKPLMKKRNISEFFFFLPLNNLKEITLLLLILI